MSQKLVLKATGLYTNYNSLGTVPNGALLVGENIVIDKDDIIEPRRGFKLFGNEIGTNTSNTAKQLFDYKNRLLRHYQNGSSQGFLEYQTTPGGTAFNTSNKLKMLFASTLTSVGTTATFNTATNHGLLVGDDVVIDGADDAAYNGSFVVASTPTTTSFTYIMLGTPGASPDTGTPVLVESTYSTLLETADQDRLKSVEANSNLYICTSNGVVKLDNYNSTVLDAGIPRALDLELELYANPDGFFQQEKQVGYRVLWGIKDANDNLVLGAPSERVFIANSALTLMIDDLNATLVKLDSDTGITDTDYSSLLALSSTATIDDLRGTSSGPQAGIKGLADKLDNDGSGPFDIVFSDIDIDGTLLKNYIGTDILVLQQYYDAIIDALNNEIAPPALSETYDNSTQASDVTLSITVPPGITTTHFYQVYRTSQSVDVNTLPNQDYQLVFENNPTLAQINDGILDIVDITPDSFRGAELYSNTNQEGEDQVNNRPPFAKDIALYNQMTFYANTRIQHTSRLDLVGLDPLTAGLSTLEFVRGADNFTINFGSSEDIPTCTALLDLDVNKTVSQQIDSTARSIIRVINRCDANNIVYAYYASTPDGVPGQMVIQARDLSSTPFTIQATNSTVTIATNTVSAYSPDLIETEESSNETKPNRIYYSKLDEPEAVPALNYSNIGGGDNVIRRIAALRDTLFIFTDEGIFSGVGQIPQQLRFTGFDRTTIIKATDSVAKGNNQIFLFTDQGVVTVSDTGVSVISRQIEDLLLPLLDPAYTNFQTATFGQFYQSDRKYILSTVTQTTDTSATTAYVYNTFTNSWVTWDIDKTCSIVSTYDDKLYLGASDTNYIEQERKNFNKNDHADREHSVNILSVSTIITSITAAPSAAVTANNHGLTTGQVISITNSDSTPSIDGEYSITVIDTNTFLVPVTTSINGTSGRWTTNEDVPVAIELDDISNVQVGDAIVQNQSETVNTTTYFFDLESPISEVNTATSTIKIGTRGTFLVGAATIYDAIGTDIAWTPQHAGDPGQMKHFREIHVMYDKFIGSDVKILVSSDVQTNIDQIDEDLYEFGNWGRFQWGKQPWGGKAKTLNIREYIPRGKQKCRLLNIGLQTQAAREKWRLEGISLFYRLLSERTNRTQ